MGGVIQALDFILASCNMAYTLSQQQRYFENCILLENNSENVFCSSKFLAEPGERASTDLFKNDFESVYIQYTW
jgi:hypothetical protein